LGIKNTAPIVNNTLGGTASHEYQYDDFYRLKSAKATYQGEFTKASYELNMSYNKMHNITKKDLVHTLNNEQKGYVLDYNYENELHPNAPNKIAESGKTEPREYVYDGNGNPTSYTEEKSFRKMTWDEENRLSGINDNGRIHQFTYDAGGERVIKSSGDSQNVAINAETAATIVHTDDYTGYVSPYFVISKGKFTKHYFEGAGRIVSKLGNGSFAQPLKLTAGGVNYGKLTAEQQKALQNYVRSLGVPPGPPSQQGIYATPEFTGNPYPSEVIKPVEENQEPLEGWPRNPIFNAPGDVPGPPVQFGPPVEPETIKAAEGFTGIGMPENDIFYFHPDHLGSTSYITSKNGSISQHVEYIAFGEILFEEHSSTFSSPYLFNGKELDRETNLSYYGARYLDMKTSIWLSVDPLAEKYSFIAPYVYVFNNPIKFIDPDGRDVVPWLVLHLKQNSLDPILQRGVLTKPLGSTMRNIMKTNTGKNYISQFMKKGDVFYGYKATEKGKYSDVILNIVQYDLQGSDKQHEGSRGFATREGVVQLTESNGKLMINIYTNQSDIDAISHELFVHNASEIDSIIQAYNEGGLEAAQNVQVNTADDDHIALRDLDSRHKGIKMYKELIKELKKNDAKYKKVFEKIKVINNGKYKDLKKD
jgi:RHS repeat-associated protein